MEHPNVVTLLDILPPPTAKPEEFQHIYLLMEDVPGCDLRSLLRDHERSFPRPLVRYLQYQCLAGLLYIFQCGLLHRDIKPENIMVREDGVVKLIDFGFTRLALSDDDKSIVEKGLEAAEEGPTPAAAAGQPDETEPLYRRQRYRRLSTHVTTRWYRAPEVLLLDPFYDQASDVWSMTACLGEMMQLPQPGFRRPLFNAVASRLSPVPSMGVGMNREKPNCMQLESILASLGSPQGVFRRAELAQPVEMKAYLASLGGPEAEKSIEAMFPDWEEEEYSFVRTGLTYDPSTRATVEDLLASSLFDCIRQEKQLYGETAHLAQNFPGTPPSPARQVWLSTPTLPHLVEALTEASVEAELIACVQEFRNRPDAPNKENTFRPPTAIELRVAPVEATAEPQRAVGAKKEKEAADWFFQEHGAAKGPPPLSARDLQLRLRAFDAFFDAVAGSIRQGFPRATGGSLWEEPRDPSGKNRGKEGKSLERRSGTRERKRLVTKLRRLLESETTGDPGAACLGLGIDLSGVDPLLMRVIAEDAKRPNAINWVGVAQEIEVRVVKGGVAHATCVTGGTRLATASEEVQLVPEPLRRRGGNLPAMESTIVVQGVAVGEDSADEAEGRGWSGWFRSMFSCFVPPQAQDSVNVQGLRGAEVQNEV